MKLQVTQENLSKALNTVARIANNRGTLPVLANVLLKTTGNRLSISATNLDVAITRFIGSKVSEEGAVTVPARLMHDFISSLPSEIINLELEDNKLHISADKYKSTINCIAADEFPSMPEIKKGQNITLPADTLKAGLQEVLVAASTDEARPVLTSVFLHNHKDKITIVSTDSYRLAEKSLLNSKKEISLLIPANALSEMLKIIEGEDDVDITYDDQQVVFKTNDVELVARLIEGKYPDYRKLIPKEFKVVSKMEKSELTNIVKIASLFARESAGSITINVDEKQQQVSIKSIASQLGENTSVAEGKIKGGGEITLNSRYLLDALNVIQGETVEFCFNGKLDPAVIKSPDDPDYLHIIMPLKS